MLSPYDSCLICGTVLFILGGFSIITVSRDVDEMFNRGRDTILNVKTMNNLKCCYTEKQEKQSKSKTK